jgi:hypothetical protein
MAICINISIDGFFSSKMNSHPGCANDDFLSRTNSPLGQILLRTISS